MTRRITFEVDPATLFDSLRATGDGGSALGARLVSVLLDQDTWKEAYSLAFYGITMVAEDE